MYVAVELSCPPPLTVLQEKSKWSAPGISSVISLAVIVVPTGTGFDASMSRVTFQSWLNFLSTTGPWQKPVARPMPSVTRCPM
ncbi:unannotated protein [freshwater metagenome]|uniref:Unannotated protein n=1 Tax=freshwater metagenome TaxID=449393 RepID=A0A6J6NXY7_9ZZZZ